MLSEISFLSMILFKVWPPVGGFQKQTAVKISPYPAGLDFPLRVFKQKPCRYGMTGVMLLSGGPATRGGVWAAQETGSSKAPCGKTRFSP